MKLHGLLRSAPRRGAAGLVLVALVAAGCGKKGPPQAPLRVRPESPRALQARQRGETIWISLREPSRRTDGSDLDAGAVLRIFLYPAGPPQPRKEPSSGEAPPVRRPTGAPSWILDRERWPEYLAGGKLEVPLSLGSLGLQPVDGKPGWDGRQIAFAAEVQEGRRHRSELAGPVALTLCEAPPPPASLEAEMTEPGVALRWPPVEGRGTRANIYRVPAGAEPEGSPHATVAASAGSYLDRSAAVGLSYSYELRFARGEGEASCESTSRKAAARAQDTFAPAPPSGLAAAAEETLIRLFWSPGAEPDLAGYVVYRREGESGEWRRMTEGLLTDTTWADTNVSPGVNYWYAVAAVDGASPPNESGRSEPVSERIR